MKIRQGLVSNSSSSSFLIVGLSRWARGGVAFDKLIETLYPDTTEERENRAGLAVYGNGAYIGLDAEEALEAGETFIGLRSRLIDIAKRLGVEVHPDMIHIYYGESGNG